MENRHLISDPVNAVTGALYEIVEEFSFQGLVPFPLFRKYGSDFSFSTSLGPDYITPLDVFIIDGGYNRHRRKEVIYHDANGLYIHFNKPVPIPGGWEYNKKHKHLRLLAGSNRSLILEEGRIKRYFKKYKDGVWRLERYSTPSGTLFFDRRHDGFLTRLRHPSGISLEFLATDNGLRAGYDVVNTNGERIPYIRYHYNDAGHLGSAINHYGEDRYYEYDKTGRRVAWSNGVKTNGRHYFDEQGRVTHLETSGAYNKDSFIYLDDMTQYCEGGDKEHKTEYLHTKDNRLTCIRNALGFEEHFDYDEDGMETRVINGEGDVTSTDYDMYGYVRTITDGEGRETDYIHSVEGDLLQIISSNSNGWEFAYDEHGNLTRVVNPEGVITEFKNNERGQPVGIMRHDGLLEQRQYDDYGRLIAIGDFRGSITRFSYDGFGRVLTITDVKGAVTKLKYEPQEGSDFWQPSRIIRPDGVALSRQFDQDRQSLKMLDGEGREVTYNYGSFELLQTIEDAKGGKLAFTYDGQERLETVTNQLGQVWSFERDAAGRVVKETDFAGLAQEYDYDKADRVIKTLHADGAHLTFAYDKSGLLLLEQAYGADDTLQDKTSYFYDRAGQLKRAENNSAVVEFKRDKLGRVIQETVNGREVNNAFDCCGNRIQREIGGRLVESTYDPLGVLKSLTIGDHQPLSMTLDPLGREMKRESATGFRLEQSYDIVGQLKKQIAGLSIASFGKGLEGVMATQKLGLDTQKLGAQVERAFEWNKNFEPTEIKDNRWGKTGYSYDANGQINEASFGDGSSERFSYDSALNIAGFGEVDTASKFTPWLSKQGGAITKATGPHGERIEFVYDTRNRVIERKVQRNGFRLKTWKYTWDAKDRLIATTTPEGERWTYGYDPFGRRITKINAAAAKAAIQQQRKGQLTEEDKNRGAYYEEPKAQHFKTKDGQIIVGTSYLWDGNTIAEEADLLGDGTTDWDNATRWHYEPNSFLPIAKEDKDGNLFYIVNDHLGTPREMFSEDGHLVWAAQYRTWGGIKYIFKPDNDNEQFTYTTPAGGGRKGNLAVNYQPITATATATATAAQDCPIRFQGQWEDSETGLYYNRYRYYDPLAGQYLSPDPIGLLGGTRPNGYVTSPNVWIDPWGLACCFSLAPNVGPNDAIALGKNGVDSSTLKQFANDIPGGAKYWEEWGMTGGTIYKDALPQILDQGTNKIYVNMAGQVDRSLNQLDHLVSIGRASPFEWELHQLASRGAVNPSFWNRVQFMNGSNMINNPFK